MVGLEGWAQLVRKGFAETSGSRHLEEEVEAWRRGGQRKALQAEGTACAEDSGMEGPCVCCYPLCSWDSRSSFLCLCSVA